MSDTRLTCAELCVAVVETGLAVRGGFHAEPSDQVPASVSERPTATVVLLGNVGGSMWPAFSASDELADGHADPLDRWSRRVVDALAVRLGVGAVYPFDGPPWLPFQRWALRAEAVSASPIGPLIHPRHGLWHAYRGALLFDRRLELPAREDARSPCLDCVDQPCLNTCPVNAMQVGVYDVDACVTHIGSVSGSDCLDQGCRARRACPVAVQAPYPAAQQALHMQAFLAARRPR